MPFNIELKARCSDPAAIERILIEQNADAIGTDHQIDTYFKVSTGRLKLREGNIENALIHYERENTSGPKKANFTLYKSDPHSFLKNILETALGVLAVVDKQRKIFFIGNVKFHVDEVRGLGCFIEIEAIDKTGELGDQKLTEQCTHYKDLLGIQNADLISLSYSDMVLAKT
ncbi:MAG TPA: class IV adenylate cyclase [Candidatus Kapabacteria bacterium]|nr:class IV adenylate cyclase [Candidatus Kapabacteria bacterium]